jgi:hypothetical protein
MSINIVGKDHYSFDSNFYRDAGCFQGIESDTEIKGIYKAKEDADYFKLILQNSVDVGMLNDLQN